MGSPKKQRKKFSTPTHPWEKERILAEKDLLKEYGLNRKYEAWKMNSILKKLTRQAKNLIATNNPQSELESKQLLSKLNSLGLANKDSKIEDVLSLSLKDLMERRLQTIVFRKNFAHSMRQSRQFIVHQHISLGTKTVTSPSYLVPVDEEGLITFASNSLLSDTNHPIRKKTEDGKKDSSNDTKESKTDEPNKEESEVIGKTEEKKSEKADESKPKIKKVEEEKK
jgi:small subunit ribosomal protein S4